MPSAVELGFLAISALVLIGLERWMPLHPRQKTLRSGWRTDLAHVFLSGAMIRSGGTLIVLGLSVLSLSLVPAPIHNAVRAQPDWLEFIELLLLTDLILYLGHRLYHAVPLLWRFHAVHHSSETLDWLAAYRVHPLEQILSSAMMALPALALGFSPLPILIYNLVYRLHAVLLHCNLRLDIGWLGRVIATPRFHHWHHADQVEAYDRNFASQLSLFDRLFGTEHHHAPDALPVRYGVTDAVPPHWIGQILQPFGLWLPARRSAPEASAAPPAE